MSTGAVLSAPPSRKAVSTARFLPEITATGLAALQAFSSRHSVGSDGLAYVEVGEAWFRGDWNAALNGTWSPLYSWLLGATLAVVRPSGAWEATLIHGVNFFIFLFVLAAFRLFLREAETMLGPAGTARRLLAWTLFLWSGLSWTNIRTVSPDLLVSGFVFLELALLIRFFREPQPPRAFALLGAVAGFGYLAKAIMLPVGLAVLATALLSALPLRRVLMPAAAAATGLLIVALPYAIPLSIRAGRPMFGDSWRYMYARNVSGLDREVHWQGGDPSLGTPIHPSRQLSAGPAIYEFATPLPGTYPPWYEPTYWYEGISPRFDLMRQMRVVKRNLKMYARMFLGDEVPAGLPLTPVIPAGLALLVCAGGRPYRDLLQLKRLWFLAIPAAAALTLYLLIHVETRYVAAWLCSVWVLLFLAVRDTSPAQSRVAGGIAVLSAAVLLAPLLFDLLQRTAGEIRYIRHGRITDRAQYQQEIASAIRKAGVPAGTPAAFAGGSTLFYWARLAGLRIVAEIRQAPVPTTEIAHADTAMVTEQVRNSPPDVDLFRNAAPEERDRLLRIFASAGARVLIAEDSSGLAGKEKWLRLGRSGYSLYRLPAQADAPAVSKVR